MASPNRYADARLLHLLSSAINTRFIAFCIIFVATYNAFLRHPVPLHSTPTSASLLQIFLFFNSLAFFSSSCGLLLSISYFSSGASSVNDAVLAPVEMQALDQRKRLTAALSTTVYGVLLLTLAALFLAAAFPFAGLIVAGDSKCLQYAVLIPYVVFAGFVMLLLLFRMPRQVFLAPWRSCMFDPQLYAEAMKQETLAGYLFTRFL